MTYEEMSMDERVDWSAAYLLKALIAGEFRSGVWMVVDMAHRHPFDLPAASKPKPSKKSGGAKP